MTKQIKKLDFSNSIILPTLLNKMLEKYNIDVEYIKVHQEIDGLPWYTYYTLTQQEYNDWVNWCMEWLNNNIVKYQKFRIPRELAMVELCYGLKIKD